MFFSGKGRESSDTNVGTSVVHTQVSENVNKFRCVTFTVLYLYESLEN